MEREPEDIIEDADLMLEFGGAFGTSRTRPTAGDVALARRAWQLANAIMRGKLEVEILHGGHAAVSCEGGMMEASRIPQCPPAFGMDWRPIRNRGLQAAEWLVGSVTFPDGGSIHVHRGISGPSYEDDRISVWFAADAGRALARAAMSEAGFKNFA